MDFVTIKGQQGFSVVEMTKADLIDVTKLKSTNRE